MSLVPWESIQFHVNHLVDLLFPRQRITRGWILLTVLAGPPGQWWLCAPVLGSSLYTAAQKGALRHKPVLSSSTCYVSDFNNLHVPPFCFNVNVPNTASVPPKVWVLQKCFWPNSPTGVIFTTHFADFLFRNLAEATVTGPETCVGKGPRFAHTLLPALEAFQLLCREVVVNWQPYCSVRKLCGVNIWSEAFS